MFTTGKCPSCKKVPASVNIQAMPVNQNFQAKWNGVSYVCPHCQTILGVGIDPVALKTDTIDGVLAGLRK